MHAKLDWNLESDRSTPVSERRFDRIDRQREYDLQLARLLEPLGVRRKWPRVPIRGSANRQSGRREAIRICGARKRANTPRRGANVELRRKRWRDSGGE